MKNVAVIFDMDGVIVNSGPYHIKAWGVFCSRHDLSFDKEDFKRTMFGKSTAATLEYFFKRKLSPEEIEKYSQEKDDLTLDAYREGVEPITGLVPLLEMIKARGITLAVATSEPEPVATYLLAETHVAHNFKTVVSGTHVKHLKPDPEIYFLTAEKIGVTPSSCVVIEDSVVGVQAGKAAGMKVIAITTSFPREKLGEADLIIDSFSELSVDRLIE